MLMVQLLGGVECECGVCRDNDWEAMSVMTRVSRLFGSEVRDGARREGDGVQHT